MQAKTRRRYCTERGTTIAEYTLTVLLLAMVAITAIRYVGAEANKTLIASGGTLTSMSNQSNESGGNASSDP